MYLSIKHSAGRIRALKVRLEFFANLSRKLTGDPQNESDNFTCNEGRINPNHGKENMSEGSSVITAGSDNGCRILKGGKQPESLEDAPPHEPCS